MKRSLVVSGFFRFSSFSLLCTTKVDGTNCATEPLRMLLLHCCYSPNTLKKPQPNSLPGPSPTFLPLPLVPPSPSPPIRT